MKLSVGQRWFIATMWAIMLLTIINDNGGF
jgi:hypothetical protein